MPLVSVLMSVYNADNFLALAIQSILNQSLTDWELIIVNDGSTDASKSIIESFDDERIRYIENETNLGLIESLNKGIDLCQGKYIARMDSDDISYPDRLEKQVKYMEANPNCVMCGTNAKVIDELGNDAGQIKNFKTSDLLKVHLLFSVPFVHPSMMIQQRVLTDNKYNDEYVHVEDYELWCRLSKLGEVTNLQEDLLEYRWHKTNVSVLNSNFQNKQKERIIREELLAIGLMPSTDEIKAHKTTFELNTLGNRNKKQIDDNFEDVEKWFDKVIRRNSKKQTYNQKMLIAYLWSRWIVLCTSQKKYGKMFFPSFASYRLSVVTKLIQIVNFLRKK